MNIKELACPRISRLWLFVLVLLFPSLAQNPLPSNPASGQNIVFVPIKTVEGKTSSITDSLNAKLYRALLSRGISNIVLLQNTGAAVSSADSCFSDSCVFDLGRKTGAQKILWGFVGTYNTVTIARLMLGKIEERTITARTTTQISGSLSTIDNQIPSLIKSLFGDSTTGGSLTVSNPAPSVVLASIEFLSSPDSVALTINGKSVGRTPFRNDSLLPGLYEIGATQEGYIPFHKSITIPEGSKKKILIKLTSLYATLFVQSMPSGAPISVNDTAKGLTPYTDEKLLPGSYKIRLTLNNYLSQTRMISLVRNKTDTVSILLVSKAYSDSARHARNKKFRNFRRIAFGTLGVGIGGLGAYYNYEAQKALDEKEKAYRHYQSLGMGSTQQEFDDAIGATEKYSRDVDDNIHHRNIFYIFGGVFLLGFAISIPF
jgi:hypothetical protein